MASLPPSPKLARSARAAARPGLTEAQRTSYLLQFHVIDLEKFIQEQAALSKITREKIKFHDTIVTRLESIAEKPQITKEDINCIIEAHRVQIAFGRDDLDAVALNKSRARAQISMHTTKNGSIHVNIPAAVAFRSLVDDLDVVVHALDDSLQSSSFSAIETSRLRSLLASKKAEVARLEQEIAGLRVRFHDPVLRPMFISLLEQGGKDETEGILVNLLN